MLVGRAVDRHIAGSIINMDLVTVKIIRLLGIRLPFPLESGSEVVGGRLQVTASTASAYSNTPRGQGAAKIAPGSPGKGDWYLSGFRGARRNLIPGF